MATDILPHLLDQLTPEEIEAFPDDPKRGLYRSAEDPDWKRCPSVYAELRPPNQRCMNEVGYKGLHISRCGFAWDDAEAAQAALNELALAAAARDKALAELAEVNQLFELQWTRMAEATLRWRGEAPAERAAQQPDLGRLLEWLMAQADKHAEELAVLRRLRQAAQAWETTLPIPGECRCYVQLVPGWGPGSGHAALCPAFVRATVIDLVKALNAATVGRPGT